MPVLTLKTNTPQDAAQRAALAGALTHITTQTLGKRAEVTAVIVENLPAAHWFVGQYPALRPTALLEISITAGTNTAAQKAEFITATWAVLQRQLAPGASLEEASYVIVREVAATDWGYGGHTQQARKALRAAG